MKKTTLFIIAGFLISLSSSAQANKVSSTAVAVKLEGTTVPYIKPSPVAAVEATVPYVPATPAALIEGYAIIHADGTAQIIKAKAEPRRKTRKSKS